MLPVFFFFFFPLWCRFSLLRGFSEASQRLLRGLASPLHHCCITAVCTGERRAKVGRRAGEKRTTFWKTKFEKYAEQHNLQQRQKFHFGQLFLKTEKLKCNKSVCYYFVLDNFWNFSKKKVFIFRQLFCKNVWRFQSKFIPLHRFPRQNHKGVTQQTETYLIK